MAANLQDHFDEMSAGYDALVARTFPAYLEAFETIFAFTDISTIQHRPIRVLELGVGTGNLSLFTVNYFKKQQPAIEIHSTLLDLSPEMLELTRQKLTAAGVQNFELVQAGFMDADFAPGSFDLIVTSIALHHLPNEDKPVLYKRIYNWLAPGGYFRCLDGHYTTPIEFAHEQVWKYWAALSKSAGATDEDVTHWKTHETQYDHFVPLRQYLSWLDEAGFVDVDCYWKKLIWAIWGGQKNN